MEKRAFFLKFRFCHSTSIRMKNAMFFWFLLTSISISLLTSCQNEKPFTPDLTNPPNIIFIMTDDHAYQAISAYGSELIETPNIDKLADQGIRFDQAHVTNSICSPSRAVILTGKFSHLNGVKDNIDIFDSTQVTYPKLLQQNGYETAVYGKWHLKSEPTGFDYWKVLPDQGDYYNPDFRTPDGIIRKEGYVTDIITDMAIHYLDSLRDGNKPFMMMYQHKAPHREWWPAQRHLKKFKDQNIPEPSTLFDDYTNRGRAAKEAEMRISDHMGLTNDNKIHPDITNELGLEDFMGWYSPVHLRHLERLIPEQRSDWDIVYDPIQKDFKEKTPSGDSLTSWKYQRYMQDYLACILSVDENIGRLMEYLEESGLAENTLVIYTSDQGFYLGEHGWFDKRFMYEESFRTPLIMRWPAQIKPGTVNTDLVQNVDFAPTMLHATGTAVPEDMQGESLIPLFRGTNNNWRDALYYHYFEYPGIHMVKRHYGVKTKQYKLIHFYNDIDEWELYDLGKDPKEMKNVYEDPEYADIKKDLHERLTELREYYKDDIK